MQQKELKKIALFLFEISFLRKVKREGLKKTGETDLWSVMEHSFLTAFLSYILAKMEGKKSPERLLKIILMALFHDFGEARVGDRDMVQRIYSKKEAEIEAFLNQVENLPSFLKEEMKEIYQEYSSCKTEDFKIVNDADRLSLFIEVREIYHKNPSEYQKWLDYIKKKLLFTKSAKKLAKIIEKTSPLSWWREIPQIKKEVEKLSRKT